MPYIGNSIPFAFLARPALAYRKFNTGIFNKWSTQLEHSIIAKFLFIHCTYMYGPIRFPVSMCVHFSMLYWGLSTVNIRESWLLTFVHVCLCWAWLLPFVCVWGIHVVVRYHEPCVLVVVPFGVMWCEVFANHSRSGYPPLLSTIVFVSLYTIWVCNWLIIVPVWCIWPRRGLTCCSCGFLSVW